MSTKLIVFDVNNASCNIAVCPNGNGLMIDCGSHSDNTCPIDIINTLKNSWLGMSPFFASDGIEYPLTLLHITHPDDDHVKNAKKVKESLTPYLVRKREHEEFPVDENIHEEYKEYIDKKYRGKNPDRVNWGFSQNKTFQIPMATVKKDENLSKKIKNNSSILRFIEYGGVKILFGGDLETDGWDWLAKNDSDFIATMLGGVNVLIAPHHGHKSGFPTALFELTKNVDVVVLSKASESEKDDTDVSSRYAEYADGIRYKSLNSGISYLGKTLTTRSNGNIYMEIDDRGNMDFLAEQASSNHDAVLG